jgi:nucleoside permease NupC
MQTAFSQLYGDQSAHTRKLTLKKETLRQLTDGELHMVAGGGVSTVSVSLSPSTRISPSTSVITPSTSIVIPGH